MFRLLRHLRQRLLAENRVSKYLVYALGEILLIVVGILIALYLDTLNSQKQTREVETQLLYELKSNLVSNIAILERTLMTDTSISESLMTRNSTGPSGFTSGR